MNLKTNFLAQLGEFTLDLLFPKFCTNCGKYGGDICAECFDSIEISRTKTCFYCGRISPCGKICPRCRAREKVKFSNVIWAGSYKDEALKSLVHGLKYNKLLNLADVIGEMLGMAIASSGLSLDVLVVPVPLHPEKEKKREFNQSELIATYVSNRLNIAKAPALRRIKETKSQVGLTKIERAENMAGAFKCVKKKLVQDRVILLIDDVATTGATLNACATVLKAAGAKRIIAAVVARG